MAGRKKETVDNMTGPLVELIEELHIGYEQQPDGAARKPTIPATKEGKVNIDALARYFYQMLAKRGVKRSPGTCRKDLYRGELLAEVNLYARMQGLKEAATDSSPGDVHVQNQISRIAAQAAIDAQAAATSRAAEQQLRKENEKLQNRIVELEAELESRDARLDFARRGILIRGFE